MEEFQQALLNFFSNEKLIKQIRTGLIMLLILLIPIFYFGFKDTLTLDALWSWDFGAIVVIITLSVLLTTIETKSWAVDITVETDKDIPTYLPTIKVNSVKINELDKNGKKSIIWCNDYNREQQKTYDDIKTNNRIDLYEKRALKHRLNGKDKKATWYDKQVIKLKENRLTDKKFIHYDIKDIRNVRKIGIKVSKKKGGVNTRTNPKKLNLFNTALGLPIRSAGLGLLGSIPFAINESRKTVILFYVGYIFTILLTILSQYIVTSFKTTHSYKQGLEDIIKLQDLLIEYLETPKEVYKEKDVVLEIGGNV